MSATKRLSPEEFRLKVQRDALVEKRESGGTIYGRVRNFTADIPSGCLLTIGYVVSPANQQEFAKCLARKLPRNRKHLSAIMAETATMSGGSLVVVRATSAIHRKLAFGSLPKDVYFMIQPKEREAIKIRCEALDININRHLALS